jgi:GT2 family glycosyltransferase
VNERVSVIVPTIGRPEPLRRLLESLRDQTVRVHEVLIADGSDNDAVAALTGEASWSAAGLSLRRIAVQPPNAVRQRCVAIAEATGDLLLFLDDDVVLEPDCVERMIDVLRARPTVVAVLATFRNQAWPMPTRAWRFYLRRIAGLGENGWQGRVVGPLLRFGYEPLSEQLMPMEWVTTGQTMVRRSAYDAAGGFSDFFLHRCTMNEDVDLGIKLAKVGAIVLNPAARLAHFHAPGGRVSAAVAAEDDLYNRYLIMRRTQGRSAVSAFGSVLTFVAIETVSNFAGSALRMRPNGLWSRTVGRLRAIARIVATS